MTGKKGAGAQLRHIPEARVGQVGHIHQHPQVLHPPDEGPPLPGQPPACLLRVGAGEGV